MSNQEYKDLMQGLQDAIEHARGDRILTVHEIPVPKKPGPMTAAQIVSLRKKKLHLSQAYFAQILNTSPKTVQAWEQGARTPSSCALRFLWLLYRKPELAPTVAAAF